MPNTFQCPACGGLIEYTVSNQDMTCPFCGQIATTPAEAAAATVVMSRVEPDPVDPAAAPVAVAQTMIQQSRFNSTAEIIDEVKRLLGENDKDRAVKVYRKEFNVSLADARTAVDQIEIDMQHSGKEETPPPPTPVESAPPPPPASSEPAVSGDVVFDAAPPQKSSTRNWIIGCSIALVCCCCCVGLLTVAWYLKGNFGY